MSVVGKVAHEAFPPTRACSLLVGLALVGLFVQSEKLREKEEKENNCRKRAELAWENSQAHKNELRSRLNPARIAAPFHNPSKDKIKINDNEIKF